MSRKVAYKFYILICKTTRNGFFPRSYVRKRDVPPLEGDVGRQMGEREAGNFCRGHCMIGIYCFNNEELVDMTYIYKILIGNGLETRLMQREYFPNRRLIFSSFQGCINVINIGYSSLLKQCILLLECPRMEIPRFSLSNMPVSIGL